jgi:small subunit ribosomal protein S9
VSKPLVQATGRRKRAIARVCLRNGTGKVTINGRDITAYLPSELLRMQATEPLRALELADQFDVDVTMDGGGIAGQAGALRLGIARALAELDPERRAPLKKSGFLTRDDRKKESKKYGLKKARKAGQYSKR